MKHNRSIILSYPKVNGGEDAMETVVGEAREKATDMAEKPTPISIHHLSTQLIPAATTFNRRSGCLG